MSGGGRSGAAPRATIDTNLFVSGLISSGAPKRLIDAWERGDVLLVLSSSLVEEISTVLRRPTIRERYRVTEEQILRIETGIRRYAEIVSELDPLPDGLSVRDPKDEYVLRTALTGKAEYLISGDDDLLSLDLGDDEEALRVVRVREFLDLLGPSE